MHACSSFGSCYFSFLHAFFFKGRARGGEVRCYTCGKSGHKSWECTERKKEGGGEAHIAEAQKHVEAEAVEGGNNLMMRKVLLKPEKEMEEPVQ
jgi:ssDNA-binding Zn-finger/Zn-ribbon topoisomerase 1